MLVAFGPIAGLDATGQDLTNRLQPPIAFGGTWSHPLGTDGLGRDVLARLISAARLSLVVGMTAATLSAVIGVSIGLLAGSVGGWFDRSVTALVELILAVPTIVVGIVLTATLGQSLINLLTILVISGWIGHARIVRLQVRSLMRSGYVIASQASGAGTRWVAIHHLFPNVLPIVIVFGFQQIAAVMLWEASLTFLGIGLPIERVSLGGMIKEGQTHIYLGWWISVLPGLLIAWAVVGFTLAADCVQRQLDPARGRRRATHT